MQYYNHALKIRSTVLGHDHPDVADLYNSIAVVCFGQRDFESAVGYLRQCMEIKQRVFGHDHVQLATTYNNLGAALKNLGRMTEALDCYGGQQTFVVN